MDEEIIEFVKRSQYRQRVLISLDGNVLMPKEIAKRSDIKTNHVSKVLLELKNKGLVELINPEARKGRLYRLTDHGKDIVKNME
ncbi:MAG: Rrf2 family transcriptional regulator [Methanobrevibacter sp.]|uniref:transcriptional regulator n=1 Tax=Methanobrevibacter sp. TaxID=66852 RepID=UPI0025F14AF4|nr:transcriptional regulator [Methanobrevibacter sp.]MBE6509424.1 Rrf2 family transcriptional regulator [Methanobrevibacter sp.]